MSTDEWRTDPDFLQYVSTLGAYSIEKLRELHFAALPQK